MEYAALGGIVHRRPGISGTIRFPLSAGEILRSYAASERIDYARALFQNS